MLGNGTKEDSSFPVQVRTGSGYLSDISDISAGYRHSLALKNDGTVWAWGFNGRGRLGDGTDTTRTVAVRVWGLTDVVAISAGFDHSMALKSDEKLNEHFVTKHMEFIALEYDYISAIHSFVQEAQPLAQMQPLSSDAEETMPRLEIKDMLPQGIVRVRTVQDDVYEAENETGIEMQAVAFGTMAYSVPDNMLVMENPGTTSVRYTVNFPSDGASNLVYLVDYNVAEIDWNGRQISGRYNGEFEATGLKPGGFYSLVVRWGNTNFYFYFFQTQYIDGFADPPPIIISGEHVDINPEPSDYTSIPDHINHFNKWSERLDIAYEALHELTGYTPPYDDKTTISSHREIPLDGYTNGIINETTNDTLFIYAWAENPIIYYQPHLHSQIQRLPKDDWSRIAIHEISHHFDNPNWEFDLEALADFKMYYVVDTENAKVYDDHTRKYYTGAELAELFAGGAHLPGGGHDWSYNIKFRKGEYHYFGLVHLLIEIQKKIGWDPFKKTFEEMGRANGIATISTLSKLNCFLTTLQKHNETEYNVFDLISETDKGIIAGAEEFGYGDADDIKPYELPAYPEKIENNLQFSSDISLNPGEHVMYKFTPKSSGSYTIFTSRYSDSGADNNTRIEMYSDLELMQVMLSGTQNAEGFAQSGTVQLSKDKARYIKVYNPNSTGRLHAQLNIYKDSEVKRYNNIVTNQAYPVSLNVGQLALYTFTPDEDGGYIFRADE